MKRIIRWYLTGIAFTAAGSLLIAASANGQEKIEVPEEVIQISEELGQAYSICPETIQAIGWVESRFQADAVNGDCTGIMQVSGMWHEDRMARLGVKDLTEVRGNMTVAVDFLSELVKDGEDLEEALMKYHGESRIGQRLEAGEMSEYVEEVLEVSSFLEEMHGK